MKYDKSNPYLASIKERYILNKPGSKKCTQHLVLQVADPELRYAIGDSVAIFPRHDDSLVAKTLEALGATGNEIVRFRQENDHITLRFALQEKLNITHPTRKILTLIADRLDAGAVKEQLQLLLNEENKEALKQFLKEAELWKLLSQFPVSFSPQELCDLLPPLLPRFYSIASSPIVDQGEIHLTVALVRYEQNQAVRHGVCSHFLCNLAKIDHPEIPIYIQPTHSFTLPSDLSTPIIMVGPGTGIAPFRAFMREREARGATGKNWLFFGDWNRDLDFLYQNYWETLMQKGVLKLHTAFSRDHQQKVYVQHLMLENASELFSWLEQGAYFYVCGDADRMARDVEAALLQIISQETGCDEKGARDYLKKMRHEKRYLRDVY